MEYDFQKFLRAQNHTYLRAAEEIAAGRKQGHWMWYIFPQLKGLGKSEDSQYYGIESLEEAEAFLAHPVLGPNLVALCTILLNFEQVSAETIFGPLDRQKLQSCMTLFALAANAQMVFIKVLTKFFDGQFDERTRSLVMHSCKG